MIQDIARRLQVLQHHNIKNKHKRMYVRCHPGKNGNGFEAIDNQKITPNMIYN